MGGRPARRPRPRALGRSPRFRHASALSGSHAGRLQAELHLAACPDFPNQLYPGWLELIEPTIRPGGTYGNYARILGQTCLLARQRPELTDLVRHLRIIEGTGIYSAGRTIWPKNLSMNRACATGFALWIKGRAILNEALPPASDAQTTAETLLAAARHL